jgi:hypothetical protein
MPDPPEAQGTQNLIICVRLLARITCQSVLGVTSASQQRLSNHANVTGLGTSWP